MKFIKSIAHYLVFIFLLPSCCYVYYPKNIVQLPDKANNQNTFFDIYFGGNNVHGYSSIFYITLAFGSLKNENFPSLSNLRVSLIDRKGDTLKNDPQINISCYWCHNYSQHFVMNDSIIQKSMFLDSAMTNDGDFSLGYKYHPQNIHHLPGKFIVAISFDVNKNGQYYNFKEIYIFRKSLQGNWH